MNCYDITVYIVTKDRLNLLKRCVNSILEQDYDNYEIIVVDDGSTDKTRDYLNDLALNSNNVRCYYNDTSKGACYSRNIAIKEAYGKFITGSDDDDYFLPNRLSNFMKHSGLLQDYTLLHSHNIFLTNKGFKKSLPNTLSPKIVTNKDLLSYNALGNQVFTKTKILKKYLFNESLPAWQDFELWYRILHREKNKSLYVKNYTYIQDVLHDSERISGSKLSKIKIAMDIFKKNNNLSELESSVLSNHLRNYENNKILRKKNLIKLLKYRFSLFNLFLSIFYSLKFFLK